MPRSSKGSPPRAGRFRRRVRRRAAMSFHVVHSRPDATLSLRSAFERPPPPPGHSVLLGGSFVDPADLVGVPVRASVGDRRLEIRLEGATFSLDVEGLTDIGTSVSGYANLSVAEATMGGRLLVALGALVGKAIRETRGAA